MAALMVRQVRDTAADVVDSREVFEGHADIKHGFAVVEGEPPPAEVLYTMRQRTKRLRKVAAYFADPDPSSVRWMGPEIRPQPL
jgi:hypothetical protein